MDVINSKINTNITFFLHIPTRRRYMDQHAVSRQVPSPARWARNSTDSVVPWNHRPVVEAHEHSKARIWYQQRQMQNNIDHMSSRLLVPPLLYKCIHGAAPSYLTNLCVPVATNTNRHLRSATLRDLLVPMTRTVTFGPLSFAVFGRIIWNTVPSTLRVLATTLGQFQSGLKTILFCLDCGTWLFRPLD